MKFKIFIESNEQKPRIIVEVHGDWSNRVFFEAYLNEEHKNFLEKGQKISRGEATVDLNQKSAYINRIDAVPRGQKFGSELLEFILEELKKHGYEQVRAYIENSNADSRLLFKKYKFKQAEKNQHGSYWELKL